MSKIRKLMAILFVVLFVVTVTAGAMSAAKHVDVNFRTISEHGHDGHGSVSTQITETKA